MALSEGEHVMKEALDLESWAASGIQAGEQDPCQLLPEAFLQVNKYLTVLTIF